MSNNSNLRITKCINVFSDMNTWIDFVIIPCNNKDFTKAEEIDKKACESGDIAYMYYKNSDTLYKMKIIHVICSYKNDLYNELIKDEDVLIKGEEKYKADTSAEFITDTKNYLVWFREISVCI